MAASPNIMTSNNPAIIDGGQFGTQILGDGITIDPSPGETTIIGTVNLDAVVVDGADVNGNLTFSGTGRRITGDMSNATAANRLAFQTSTVNSNTTVTVIPNGTADAAGLNFENAASPANNSVLNININSAGAAVSSGVRGTGTFLPISINAGSGGLRCVTADISGNVAIGGQTALATTATDRFLHINAMAGTPTGVPNAPVSSAGAMAGKVPMTVDTTNNRVYFYVGGSWKYAALT